MFGKRLRRKGHRGSSLSQFLKRSQPLHKHIIKQNFVANTFFDLKDWNNWKLYVRNFYKNHGIFSESLLPLFVNKSNDNRPYISVKLFDIEIIALLDSGANMSVIGEKGLCILKRLGLKIYSSNLAKVATADGTKQAVEGIVDLPVDVNKQIHVISAVVVPALPHAFIFGSDFCRSFEILINFKNSRWEVQSKFSQSPLYVVNNLIEMNEISTDCEDELSLSEQAQAKLIVDSFQAVSSVNCLGRTDKISMTIDTGDAIPFKKRQYHMSPYMLKVLNQELDEMLKLGVVEPSESSWNSPVLLVKKSSGEFRFCFDGRELNKITKPDSYPLPRVDRIMNYAGGAKFISTIDLRKAFWQIPLDPDSREKTAFSVPGRGLFHFTVVPFGLCNSAQKQQRLVDKLLGPKYEPHVFCYLDDIVIVSKSFEEHCRLLEEVREILKEANLTINLKKCKFFQTALTYLGFVIDRHGIRTDPEKVSAMINYPRPKNSTEVKRFVGLCSWYRRFIQNFSDLMSPINSLLKGRKKKQPIQWTPEAETAFIKIKSALVSAPILCSPDFSRSFTIQSDASGVAIGGILTQEIEGIERVIAYASRSLSKSEKNFSTMERELLAIIFCIEKFRGYVEGTRFKVLTDHASLQWLNNFQNATGRLARWQVKLQQYSFDLIYKKGSSNIVPDFLSRTPPLDTEISSVHSNDDHLEVLVIDIEPTFSDKWYLGLRDKVQANPDLYPQFKVENNILYKYIPSRYSPQNDILEWKFVVPKSQRLQVIRSAHDPPHCAHFGFFKTLNRVQQYYYFPKMRGDVLKFVKSCKTCQSQKLPNSTRLGLMGAEKPAKFPFQIIAVDIMGPFPRSPRGFSYLLVVADWFSKYTLLCPMRDATANNVVKFLENQVFLIYGVPQFIICDNGSQFAGKTFKKLAETYQIQKIWFSPRYAAQCNFVERNNKTVGQAIRSYLDEHKNWDRELSKIQFAINTAVHHSHGFSPAYLVFARHIPESGNFYGNIKTTQGIELCPASREDYVNEFSNLSEVFNVVKEKLHKAYLRNSKSYNLRKREFIFNVGDKVWRRNRVLSDAVTKFSAKLAPKYILCTVKKRVSKLVYLLENQNGTLAGEYHIKDLKPHFGSNSDISVN